MGKKKTRDQAYRAAALEAALDAMAKAGRASGAERIELDPENVLRYAKFILGKRPATGTPLLEVRTRLDSTEADEEFPRPVGEDPGDREVLTQWAEAIRSRNAEQEREMEAAALEAEPEVGETNKSAGAEEWIAAGGRSEDAPDHVVQEGAVVGCPECSAELERREKRDEAKEEGRRKLASRRVAERAGSRGVALDEDELLAVAGSEVYPPNDEEPSRELKIRNRMGEVRTWKSGGAQEGHGWTASPEDPWGLRYAWTSLEMSRRGPWHVI